MFFLASTGHPDPQYEFKIGFSQLVQLGVTQLINVYHYSRYFTLFMNLMSRSADLESVDRRTSRRSALSLTQTLNQSAVQAMSNLLNANIDTGLMYAIGKQCLKHLFVEKKNLNKLS